MTRTGRQVLPISDQGHRLPDSWGDDPQGPIGKLECDAERPIAIMQRTVDGWPPALSDRELGLAYQSNVVQGIEEPSSAVMVSTERMAAGTNVIYADGSGQHRGIGWSVSACVDSVLLRMHSGWVPHGPRGRTACHSAHAQHGIQERGANRQPVGLASPGASFSRGASHVSPPR